MQKSKIEWTDYTWNPIKGLCPVRCWYCYARKIYKRFGWEKELLLKPSGSYRIKATKPSKIFVCSTMELFHPDIPRSWRKIIFGVIESNPHHTFQILTKMPENIDRPMPRNVWLGVSVTRAPDMWGTNVLKRKETKVSFISLEPFLDEITGIPEWLDWLIVGKLTGHGKKYDPPREWIIDIVNVARDYKIPLFMKENLKDIWGKELIQEFPE